MSTAAYVSSFGGTPANMYVQLFIPSVLIYALRDQIPFHLQISGPPAMLLGLVRQSTAQNPVRVHLVRRVCLLVRGNRHCREIDIGEGTLSVLPPPISCLDHNPHEAAVDWAGVVRCYDSITAGTFDAGTLSTKVSCLVFCSSPLY